MTRKNILNNILPVLFNYLILLFIVLILACAQKNDENTVVAKVGDFEITVAAFSRSYIDEIRYTPASIQDSQVLREKHLEDMITRHFLAGEALKARIDTLPGFKRAMYAESTAVIIHGLYEKEIAAEMPPVTDDEIAAAYKRMQTELQVSHLVSSTKTGIDSLYNRLQSGESFNALAKECFHDSTLQSTGGNLGFVKWGDLDIDFENAAYNLQIGHYSKPVATKFGWHIIRLENIQMNPIARNDEFLSRKESIKRQIQKRYLKNKADLRIKALMQSKDVIMNVPLIRLLEKERRRLKDNTFSQKTSIETAPAFTSLFEKYKNENIASYNGGNWTVTDFLNSLATVPGRLTENTVYKAVAMGIRNYFLLDIAKDKNIDKIDVVRNTVSEKREHLLSHAFLDMYADTCSFTDTHYRAFYEKIKNQYNKKDMSVLEILVRTEKEARDIMNKILASDKSEKVFRDMAKTYTIRPGFKEKEGYLGFITKNDYGQIGKQCYKMQKNGLMGPIKTKEGFSIVFLLDVKSKTVPYESVKEDIVKLTQQKKRTFLFQEMKEKYIKDPQIVVDRDVLQKVF